MSDSARIPFKKFDPNKCNTDLSTICSIAAYYDGAKREPEYFLYDEERLKVISPQIGVDMAIQLLADCEEMLSSENTFEVGWARATMHTLRSVITRSFLPPYSF